MYKSIQMLSEHCGLSQFITLVQKFEAEMKLHESNRKKLIS